MQRAHWVRVGLIVVGLGVGTLLNAQTPIPTTTLGGVTLKTFTPVESLFVNPTATTFTIALKNTVVGTPTEYRASRFSDFRDATWRTYSPSPTMTVTSNMFTATPGNTSSTQVMLYLQVRAKNPKAGQPASLIDGKLTTQPDFFFSDPLGRRVRIVFAG